MKYAKILTVLTLGLIASPAFANPMFTEPQPSLDEAIAAAKTAGKPLVIEFSATWCAPCKALAAELHKPEAKPVLDSVYLVVYNGDEDPGESLMQKFNSRSFPTMIAVGGDGKEIARRSGYVPFPIVAAWFKELPDRTMPLPEFLKKADSTPTDGRMQLVAGKRLVEIGEYVKARSYYTRARTSKDGAIASAAEWKLTKMEYDEQRTVIGGKLAARMASRSPASEEGEEALRYLAAMPKPPVALLEKAVEARMKAFYNDAEKLNGLTYIALKGGALKAATKLADRLTQLDKGATPETIDTIAEVYHMKGDDTRAIELEEKAVAMANAKAGMGIHFEPALARFRRGKKEPAEELLTFRGPSLEPDKKLPPVMPPPASPSSNLFKTKIAVEKKIQETCWKEAADALGFYALVTTGSKASDNVIAFRPGTPKGLTDCAAKILKEAEFPEKRVVEIYTHTMPKNYSDTIEKAVEAAKKDCALVAGNTKTVEGILTGVPGKHPTLALATGSAELRACVDKAFMEPTPVTVMQQLKFEFGAGE